MQEFEYPTIVHCEAAKVGDNRNIRYDILVALQVREWRNTDIAISEALASAGYAFMYSDTSQPLDSYLATSPQHYSTAMALCQQLSDEQPITCQKVAILGGDSDTHSALSYLDIEALSTPKPEELDCQAFWERPWINPDLKEILFKCNQPDPESADNIPPQRTYVIVDATRYIEYRGVFDIDLISDCPVMCMFTGESAETLKMAAPYLIDMTLSTQAYQDDSRVSHFHRRFFDTLWENNVGIFIQSSAPMEAIHQHFRKFLKFNIEGGNNRFFRYWDPRVIKTHLTALTQYHKASHHFFNLPVDPNTRQPHQAVTFIYEDHRQPPAESDDSEIITSTKIARFNSDNYLEMKQRISDEGNSANPVADIALIEIIDKEFTQQKYRQFCDKTAIWLTGLYGNKQFEEMPSSEFLFKQLPSLESRFQLKLEYEVKYVLAGCYLLESNIEDISESYLQHLENFQMAPAHRAESFLSAILAEEAHQENNSKTSKNKDVI